jgi:predicted deacylase
MAMGARTFAPRPTGAAQTKVQPASAMQPVARPEPESLWARMTTAVPIQRHCMGCDAEGERPVGADALVDRALSTGGQPLDAATQANFANRTGHDLGGVRVHNDGAAAASARALAARAYTVGPDIVFGAGAFAPGTPQGQRLLAHELTHVVQQRAASSPAARQPAPLTVSAPGDRAEREAERVAGALEGHGDPAPIAERPGATLARAAFDVDAIATDADALAGQPVMIGTLKTPMSQLFLKFLSTGGHSSGDLTRAADFPTTFTRPASTSKPLPKDKLPRADAVPPLSSIAVEAHFFPSAWPTLGRALVLGGFHGDEQPGFQVTDALVNELSQPGAGVGLGFHTIVVPRVNAAAIRDELSGVRLWRNRCNRQLVDLNRNFPTKGKPKDTDCPNTSTGGVPAPIQPEVQGVIDIVTKFKPDRIVSTHAIADPKSAGIFADPNRDAKAVELARGMASTVVHESDRPANRLGPGRKEFNPVYPGDKPGVVSGGTSLGAWAPTAVKGRTIPVITTEAPGSGPLGSGTGSAARTVEGALRPIHAFLGAAPLATAADRDILADIDAFNAADRVAFLTGLLPGSDEIYGRIRLRVETAVANLNAMGPPTPITVHSGLRLFSERAPHSGSPQAQLDFDKFFLTRTGDLEWLPDKFFKGGIRDARHLDRDKWLATPSSDRLREILRFSSLPGTSRHHWGTEVDLNSVKPAEWEPAAKSKPAGRFFALGQWLQANAPSVGLVQAYTPGRSGGYEPEAWHYSYAPISVGLRERYNKQVNLTTDVIDKITQEFQKRAKAAKQTMPGDFEAALKQIDISDLVNNLGPGL